MNEVHCALCQNPANQRCTGCHITFYCGKEHQKQHWKKHKNNCCAFKVLSSESLGRHLIATRDLKPGELVLYESPLTVAPIPSVEEPVCIVCYKEINGKFRCKSCGWPICGDKCQESREHTPECTITKHRKITNLNMKKILPLYEVVAIFRLMYYKYTDKSKYGQIQELISYGKDKLEKSTLILRMIRTVFQVPRDKFSDEEILHLCGVLYINAHEVPISPCVQAIYFKASLIEHNCLNNASKHFDSSNGIQIRAAVPIQKGDHISITYTDPMWGTFNRKMHLKETKNFICSCSRCVDPSELDTFFSSLKCQSCPIQNQGFLLPRNPLEDNTSWYCSVCNIQEQSEYVEAVTRSIGEELIKLEKSNMFACKNFLKKHSQNLHPNHYYLMDVKLALCQMLANRDTDFGDKDLVLKQKICIELINVVNILSPGISRLRGVVMYELQKALFLYAKRKYDRCEISLEHMINVLKEVKQYLKECIHIFGYEPASLQEGQICTIAQLDLVELDAYIDSIIQK